MRIFKNLQAAAMASILIASFMFLLPGAGISHADGYARHFKPDHVKGAQVKQTYKQGYHNYAARHQGKRFTQQTVTTTRYAVPRGATQRHADKYCGINTSRHHRGDNRHLAQSSFSHHQKLRQSNIKHQRRAQQQVRHNLGLFAALPGIIINIPL